MTKVLTQADIKRLKSHMYQSTGESFLTPYLQPWWDWTFQFVPLWLSPNLMTVTGLVFSVSSSLVILYYGKEVPRWAALFCLLATFVDQTLDALDGKQARRTKSSSSFGELLDHGSNALSSMFLTAAFYVTLGQQSLTMYSLFLSFITAFYLSNWQTYVCGTYKYYYLDLLEAQYFVIIVHFITFLFGYQFWHYHIGSFMVGQIVACFTVLFSIAGAASICKAILSRIVKQKGMSFAGSNAWSPAGPLVTTLIIAESFVFGLKRDDFDEYFVLYALTIGLVMTKMSCQLILAYMIRRKAVEWTDSIFFGPIILMLNRRVNLVEEPHALFSCFAYVLMDCGLFYGNLYHDFC